jgi:hypothetical protein
MDARPSEGDELASLDRVLTRLALTEEEKLEQVRRAAAETPIRTRPHIVSCLAEVGWVRFTGRAHRGIHDRHTTSYDPPGDKTCRLRRRSKGFSRGAASGASR